MDGSIELTLEEKQALKRLLLELAQQELEDMIGLFMRHGLFRELPGDKLVELVKKLED